MMEVLARKFEEIQGFVSLPLHWRLKSTIWICIKAKLQFDSGLERHSKTRESGVLIAEWEK